MDQKGIGILIVDDEFSVRDSLFNWFKVEGYRVSTAENGMEALKKLQENSWDIVLLDIKMPGMDGMEVQRHIKKIDSSISMNKNVAEISPKAMEILTQYEWPGNIRELRNTIERALVVVGKEDRIKPEDINLPRASRSEYPEVTSLEELERHHIQRILDQTNWNITRAAEILKIDRVTFYNKIKKYNLQR